MENVNFVELGQHLPDYLQQVERGKEIGITMYGKIVALLVPYCDKNGRDAAIQRLEKLRGKMIIGDVLTSMDEEWTGDTNNL